MLSQFKRLQQTTWGNLLILACVTALILGGLWLVSRDSDESPAGASEDPSSTEEAGQVSEVEVSESNDAAPEIGQPAPEFTARTLEGETVDIADLDKPVWITFNATWCSNCRAEMPDIQKAVDEWGEDIDIVSVYIQDSPTSVATYVNTLGLTGKQIVDDSDKIGSLYRVAGVPSHYFIGEDGTLRGIDVGVLSPDTMEQRVRELID